MDTSRYEPHSYLDPNFPFIFHLNNISKNKTSFWTHWHENIEILYVIEGEISVLADANYIIAKKNDMVIINSNNIHHIKSISENSKYYCLIIDKEFCKSFDIYIKEMTFQNKITDSTLNRIFEEIKKEFLTRGDFYKFVIKSNITRFLIYIYRKYIFSQSPLSNKLTNIKEDAIKQSIRYIQDNYDKRISTSDVAEKVGVSKYYFCRIFKELTGYTVINFINLARCSNAKRLLQSGEYTVNEAATLCGFENFSYFSRTYKKHMGVSPSMERP